MLDRNYGGVIWTNHALQRLRERGIKQGDAWATWNRPEQSYKGNLHKGEDAWRFYRTYGNERIEVVARQDENKKWIILSVWSKEVFNNKSEAGGGKKKEGGSFWIRLLRKIFF
jgi:hypothetical protein